MEAVGTRKATNRDTGEVYLFAMNLNLPRCSHVIGRRLSRGEDYLLTALDAFRPSWDRWIEMGKDHGNETPIELDLHSRARSVSAAYQVNYPLLVETNVRADVMV